MGKASSNKKVARAAKAGGSRARAAGERNFVFPLAMVIVVVLGTVLVVYARDNRQAEALEAPLLSDHWHSAYGFYVCDEFVAQMPEYVAPKNGGIHTHGDGLFHIHPFSSARTGENATINNVLADAADVIGGGDGLTDDSLGIPGDATYTEGDDTCEGLDGEPIVQVAVWESAQAAIDGDDPSGVVTEDFDRIRFLNDGQAYTIAFAPEGADLPAPPSTTELSSVGSDLGVPVDSIPDDAEQPGADDPTASTVDEGDDPTSTTEAGDPTSTTEAGDAPDPEADTGSQDTGSTTEP